MIISSNWSFPVSVNALLLCKKLMDKCKVMNCSAVVIRI
jgi:hypothetical protein